MHPKLKILFNYLVNMTELMNKLNLPIIRITPSGLKITQNYVKFEPRFTLRYSTTLINKIKQKQSIVPNLVHSIDATNLALLVKNLRGYIKNKNKTNNSIYTVPPN